MEPFGRFIKPNACGTLFARFCGFFDDEFRREWLGEPLSFRFGVGLKDALKTKFWLRFEVKIDAKNYVYSLDLVNFVDLVAFASVRFHFR